MTDSREPGSNVIPFTAVETPDDLGSCGVLRGIRDRALMLQLRLRSGRILACGYMWLDNAIFVPEVGITLSFASQRVTIIGQNLDAEIRSGITLFDALMRHRVAWLRESDATIETSRGELVIERIDIEDFVSP